MNQMKDMKESGSSSCPENEKLREFGNKFVMEYVDSRQTTVKQNTYNKKVK